MHNENKVPLIRLAKRDMMEPWKVWCIRLASIVLALLLGGLVMMIALPDGATPIDGYATIITGALGKKTAVRQTVKLAVPLLGCALAIAPCFKMRFWNIGAEGQITAGAIAASYFALYWVGRVPSAVLLLIMGLAVAVAGGIWALIPAFFKAKWNTNETLFTLMMNYIIIGVVRWLQGGPWEGRPGSQIIPMFDQSAWLPEVFGVHCGWIIVLVLVVVRAMSRNCQKRYEENMKFERAFGGIGRKFSFWKRKFADRKTHVYIKCGVCKKTLRLPKVKGEHTVKCPNCANKFKVKI